MRRHFFHQTHKNSSAMVEASANAKPSRADLARQPPTVAAFVMKMI
jgi:hypothetical protein